MVDTLVSHVLPFLVALGVSTVTSTAGVSGAFLLLPFQVSVLGFTGPGVTPTNHLFNVIAIPSAVYRYVREHRMVWPLSAVIVIGTLPGVVLGVLIRIRWLPDARSFKAFMGGVLLLLGMRLLVGLRSARPKSPPATPDAFHVRTLRCDWRFIQYEFRGARYGVSSWKLTLLAAIVGIVGGAYGVGGGAIIAPLLVSVAQLPVHTVAGATLFATFLTSLVAVGGFTVAGLLSGHSNVAPDWMLGVSLGVGGLLGMYCGARIQRYLPARVIEGVLALSTTGLALAYLARYLLGTG
jgi:uncharacterized membrane protein YfcA